MTQTYKKPLPEVFNSPIPWEAGKAYKHSQNSWMAVIFAPAKNGKPHSPRAAEAFGINKEECEANVKLIVTAANNLHHLAEALGKIVPWMESLKDKGVFVPDSLADHYLTAAKEALNRIS